MKPRHRQHKQYESLKQKSAQEANIRMEPVASRRPDTFEYFLDLTRGITVENPFAPKEGWVLRERVTSLEREVAMLRRNESRLLSDYEDAIALKRSFKSLGKKQVSKVSSENLTEVTTHE